MTKELELYTVRSIWVSIARVLENLGGVSRPVHTLGPVSQSESAIRPEGWRLKPAGAQSICTECRGACLKQSFVLFVPDAHVSSRNKNARDLAADLQELLHAIQ